MKQALFLISNRRILSALAFAVCLSAASVQAQPAAPGKAASGPAATGQQMPMAGMSGGAQGSQKLHQSMMSGMDGMRQMQPSGDIDKDFAMMMKMHHQQALDMAKVEVEQGKSPELKAMARKIIKDQTREIGQFDKWLKGRK
jgi:uncharacterized protein (DUF305 family)